MKKLIRFLLLPVTILFSILMGIVGAVITYLSFDSEWDIYREIMGDWVEFIVRSALFED